MNTYRLKLPTPKSQTVHVFKSAFQLHMYLLDNPGSVRFGGLKRSQSQQWLIALAIWMINGFR